MKNIGNMLWRIGELLDFDEQLAWTREAGFGGVGFHASAGSPGKWSGVEPAASGAADRARLRRDLAGFSFHEIHAPFAIELSGGTLSAGVDALAPVFSLASDLGVGLVTVHALFDRGEGKTGKSEWIEPMERLNEEAEKRELRVGLETIEGFERIIGWRLPNVGVTLDVGHMYLPAAAGILDNYGGIGDLIRYVGPALFHLHLHDVRDGIDHVEIGTGEVAFEEIAAGLKDIRYPYGMILEMNPDRADPDAILRSAAAVSRCTS